jgi:hypothetical protein
LFLSPGGSNLFFDFLGVLGVLGGLMIVLDSLGVLAVQFFS